MGYFWKIEKAFPTAVRLPVMQGAGFFFSTELKYDIINRNLSHHSYEQEETDIGGCICCEQQYVMMKRYLRK